MSSDISSFCEVLGRERGNGNTNTFTKDDILIVVMLKYSGQGRVRRCEGAEEQTRGCPPAPHNSVDQSVIVLDDTLQVNSKYIFVLDSN